MVTKEEFTYKSRDGQTEIHAIRWIPDSNIVGILQIVHGMQEFIDRYDPYARYMAERGILVTGNDHLGHGESLDSKKTLGYFCEDDPATVVVRDVHRLKKITQEKYPGIPIVILGHSFGSYTLREYISRYGTGIDAAIIQGTGMESPAVVSAGKLLANITKLFHGARYRSNFMNNIAFGAYLKKIPNARTKFDWLSHNEASVDAYIANPKDNFVFTVNGFLTLFDLVGRTQDREKMSRIPKNLKLLITAGTEDPVGGYAENVKKLYNIYKDELGFTNVDLKLYEGMRHELQQEIGSEQVFEDQYNWISNIYQGK
ncbi:MAG: alpha/beta hydrolase [Butyrivibrio sp.]|nr:alpha/beta hydrolase [Butyrivibrio sp.]